MTSLIATMFNDVIAVLDANVLYPMPLCDMLLRLAEHESFFPRWSNDILEEVRRNLVKDGRCSPAQALRRIQLMEDAFPEANVRDYERLLPSLTNDQADRHVLAAAIRTGADFVVTHNVRHFPDESLIPFGVQAISPDTFLHRLYADNMWTLSEIVIQQATSLQRPLLTPRQVLRALAPHIPNVTTSIEAHLERSKPWILDSSPGLS